MKNFVKNNPVMRKLNEIENSWKDLQELKEKTKKTPIKLAIGSSWITDAGWISTDAKYLDLLIPKHWKRLFKKNSIDAMMAEHVWEHLTLSEGVAAAKQCFEYLKPGGYLRVAVPDGFHPDSKYIEHVKVNGIGPGAEDHKVLYNYETFSNVFQQAGFRVVCLEYFDAEGEFHFVYWDPNDGLIRRSKNFDRRNTNGELNYTSLIIDCYKD